MPILNNATIETISLPGLAHQTLAGPRDGLKRMEVWMQTVAPGAATPLHRHDCEEVIVVLEGEGTCEVEGEVTSFGPGSTLIVPPNAVHRVANTGEREMRVVASLSMAPVTVTTPDGARIALPWDQHAIAG